MAVVKAHAVAKHLLRDYEFGQSDQDRHNGWRYFLEETDLVPGMSADVQTVGLSFGGGCFFENGVTTSDGGGTFTSTFTETTP